MNLHNRRYCSFLVANRRCCYLNQMNQSNRWHKKIQLIQLSHGLCGRDSICGWIPCTIYRIIFWTFALCQFEIMNAPSVCWNDSATCHRCGGWNVVQSVIWHEVGGRWQLDCDCYASIGRWNCLCELRVRIATAHIVSSFKSNSFIAFARRKFCEWCRYSIDRVLSKAPVANILDDVCRLIFIRSHFTRTRKIQFDKKAT